MLFEKLFENIQGHGFPSIRSKRWIWPGGFSIAESGDGRWEEDDRLCPELSIPPTMWKPRLELHVLSFVAVGTKATVRSRGFHDAPL
jgi:hypothetical protein